MIAIINWYDTAFDDEDLNNEADPGASMEGGGGEVPNEAGTYNMSCSLRYIGLSSMQMELPGKLCISLQVCLVINRYII